MNFAIVAAGGSGKRFGTDSLKQLTPILGRKLLGWTLLPFAKERNIDWIFLTFPMGTDGSEFQKILDQEEIKKVTLVAGGEERFHSVRNAFTAIEHAHRADLVLIHDAARPLLSGVLLRKMLDAGAAHGAAIPVVPVHETVKEVNNERVSRTIPRDRMVLVQTPQVFQYGLLQDAYSRVKETTGITDEALLLEKTGFDIWTVPGERRNIKVTEPEDMDLVEYYLKREKHS